MPVWEIAFGALAGLVLFLYGIEHFSVEIQAVAGERFRAGMGKLTQSPVRGAILGALTTVVVQSSSATTVIAVGLVNAGTISFASSLGIIIGANVGTTVTAQLVALKLTAFAPIFVVLGFVVSLVGRRFSFLGRPIFYFGLVFLALTLVSDAIEPLRTNPQVPQLLARFGSVPLAILVGLLFTTVVQSSSVTTGVVVLLAEAGVLGMEQAIPILMGANLGTTTTSLLASSRMSLHARRAAVGHLIFNLGGVLLFLPFLGPFADLVRSMGGTGAQQVANAHLVFNGVAGGVFLLAVRPLQRLIERVVRGDEEEILFVPRHLTGALPNERADAFQLIEDELRHLLEVTARLYAQALLLVRTPSARANRTVQKLEALNDFLDERVEAALLQLSRRNLERADAERVVMLVRVSNQLEQLGDTGAELAELNRALHQVGTALPSATIAELEQAGAVLSESFAVFNESFPHLTPVEAEALKANQRKLRRIISHNYAGHVQRIGTEDDYPGAVVIDALSKLESASNQLREIRKQVEQPTHVSDA